MSELDLNGAIEATAKELFRKRGARPWDSIGDDIKGVWRNEARLALSAALPHILEALLKEAEDEEKEALVDSITNTRPGIVADWLALRIDKEKAARG